MTSFGEQLRAAQAAHLAAISLESQSRAQIAKAFEDWDSGKLDALSVRHELENIVRAAYRTSAAVAAAHTASMSELPNWLPQGEIFSTDYLQSLLKDVRRNLREYKKSERDDKARRRHILRMQHSAGVAAQRGYTDSLIASSTELEDFGFTLRKFWMANFINNIPCPACRSLHGTEVGLHDAFPAPGSKPGVYLNLQGPPRHPRCQCYLVILVVTLDNLFDVPDIETPPDNEPGEMDTDDVKNLPWKIFSSIIATLRKLVQFITRV